MEKITKKVEDYNIDPEIINKIELENDYEKLQRGLLEDARNEGLNQGLEQGRNQGIQEGLEQGLEQGISQGIIQTAKNMLQEGIDYSIISKVTDLSKEEIEEIKKNM